MTFLKQISLLVLAAFLGLVLTGCQPSDPNSPKVAELTSIAVTPNPVNMEIGGVRSLTVTGTFSDDSTFIVNFGSTFAVIRAGRRDGRAATGYVTAVAAGTRPSRPRTPSPARRRPRRSRSSPLRVALDRRESGDEYPRGGRHPGADRHGYVQQPDDRARSPAGSTFVSSNPAVAIVDAAGVVTAVADGTATITATHTASGKTGTAAVTVSAGGGGGGGFADITFDSAGVAYT